MNDLDTKSIFERSIGRYGDKVAVQTPDAEITFAELDRQSNALANALLERGISKGDRVGILVENSIEFPLIKLAIIKIGGVPLSLNPELDVSEIEYLVNDAEPTALFHSVGVDHIDQLRTNTSIENYIVTDNSGSDDSESLSKLLQSDTESPDVTIQPTDEATLYYTGGTTGKPKGVIHTQYGRSMAHIAQGVAYELTEDSKLLLMTPLQHAAGGFLDTALLNGATTIVRSEFDVEQTLADIEEYDISTVFMVPTMIYRLLDSGLLDSYDTSSLEMIAYGTAPMTPDRIEEGIDAFGPVFKQFYGQTEVPLLISQLTKQEHKEIINSGDTSRLSSAGRPCLMADVKIVDPETGDKLERGEIGEIAVKAPYNLERYHNRPEATNETIQNGFVLTGDIGKFDESGYLYLLDRKSDLIITGGYNVYSVEVEEVISEHSGVQEVAVIGIPDDEWGEAVTAIVVPTQTADLDDEEIKTFVGNSLASYKKPKGVHFVDHLPKTSVGKPDKTALRQRFS